MSPRRRSGDRFRIDYADSTKKHLLALTAHERSKVTDAIDERLAFEPTKENRNRKPIEENLLEAGFELRVGELRVYYDVDEGKRVVNVLAIAKKDRDRVLIGGEEIVL